MKPPMFSPPSGGSRSQRYLHRARMFRDAAINLPNYVNGEQNWPAYALLLHACELALKAFCDKSVEQGKPSERAHNHDLQGWYRIALQYELPTTQQIAESIGILAKIHIDHYTRYPNDENTPIPDLSSVAGEVAEWLIAAASQSGGKA